MWYLQPTFRFAKWITKKDAFVALMHQYFMGVRHLIKVHSLWSTTLLKKVFLGSFQCLFYVPPIRLLYIDRHIAFELCLFYSFIWQRHWLLLHPRATSTVVLPTFSNCHYSHTSHLKKFLLTLAYVHGEAKLIFCQVITRGPSSVSGHF